MYLFEVKLTEVKNLSKNLDVGHLTAKKKIINITKLNRQATSE